MYFFKIILIFSFSFLFSKDLDIKLLSPHAIVINESGKILLEKKANVKIFPASLTKIATALYVLERKKKYLNKYFTASKNALKTITAAKKHSNYQCPAFILETDGTMLGLKVGEKMRAMSLLHALMIASSNDAANVIAENVGKEISLFMKKLNAYLKRIGCKNTNFVNPHGLHFPNHTATSYDLAIIAKRAVQNHILKKIFSKRRYVLENTNKHERRQITNYNSLLKERNIYFYPFAFGMKTGYHKRAGYNLIASAKKEKRVLIAVLLAGKKSEYRYIDAIKIFKEIFKEKKVEKVVFNKNYIFKANIKKAKGPLEAHLKEDLKIKYFPSEKMDFKVYLKWDFSKFPIKEKERVGELFLAFEDGSVIRKFLYSKNKLRKKFF